MAITPNYGFDLLASDDTSRLLIEFLNTHFGEQATSTLNVLDSALHDIAVHADGFKVVESVEEPTDLDIGDEWDKLL